MTNEQKLLIDALARSVAGRSLEVPESVEWKKLCDWADFHKVTPLLYDGLQKAGVTVPDEIKKRLHGAYMQTIFRDTQLEHLKKQVEEALVESGIRHVFLKGAVLKYDYPVPALRTMCDLDVLVYAADFPALEKVSKKLGGQSGHSDGNHRNYTFSGGVTVEFHPNLLHHDTPVGTGINPGWQYVKNTADIAAELTEEGFYLNTLCHLANHFVDGGVGVRFVLDVWVNRHLRKQQPDRDAVEKDLQAFGLLEFAHNIEALAECWFGAEDTNPVLEELGEYIFSSGLHGVSERAMLNAVTLSPGQSQSSALMKKAFFSRGEMEDRYPWCKGKTWLLPVAWIARAFRAVFKHGKLILRWGKGTGQFSKEEISRQAALLRQFGIDPKAGKQQK